VISQPQSQRARPRKSVGTGAPALALLLVGEVAFVLVFDRRLLDGRRLDFGEAHDTRLDILEWRQVDLLQRRHGGGGGRICRAGSRTPR
jgi:hypothetical protein